MEKLGAIFIFFLILAMILYIGGCNSSARYILDMGWNIFRWGIAILFVGGFLFMVFSKKK
ncbi:NhaP-type Na+/H+ or K+/H+ antiporter [Niabella hirudinis]